MDLSYVNGVLHRDLDGKSCKNRVKSLFGATSRKGTSPEEEADVRLDWGVKNSAQGSAKPNVAPRRWNTARSFATQRPRAAGSNSITVFGSQAW